MKNVIIRGGQSLQGVVDIPPSKSLSHRGIIGAGLASGTSRVDHLIYSVDIEATLQCMRQIGCHIETFQEHVIIEGVGGQIDITDPLFQCHESGSTLRFMIPIAMAGDKQVSFHGKGALKTRPLDPYFSIFDKQGISYDYQKSLPLTLEGKLQAGDFYLPGDVSSQFISGLLFALPLLDQESRIYIKAPFESKEYVTLTLDVLKEFGIHVDEIEGGYRVAGNQTYQAKDFFVEGDYSQVAFWLVAGLISGPIEAKGMNLESSQGDREVVDIIRSMGGQVSLNQDTITAWKQVLKATTIDASQCPDIIPVLTVLAAVTPGETHIINAGRLRIKECDRLHAIKTELNKLGADIEEYEDSLLVRGKENLRGGRVNGWQDHRIVMSMAIASLACDQDVIIEGSDAISKSYPHFWDHFRALGGQVDEWHL